jgi:hypothetical protein
MANPVSVKSGVGKIRNHQNPETTKAAKQCQAARL